MNRLLCLRTWFQIQDSSMETEQNLKTGGERFNYFSKVIGSQRPMIVLQQFQHTSEEVQYYSNYQTQSSIATQASKALSRQSSRENYKRTRQGVSAKLESYIYKVHMVHATISCLSHFLLKTTMLCTYALTSSSRLFHHVLGL